ncbi:NAD(P)-dependent oxidoreductase [Cereibacter sphaeroides]|uniref:NAD-dependent epimerase/dehydratase family protein n=1 Tax=Cereibacter sphaeroides TaxID=1063 RepID=UPI001F3BEFBF|nr:NAD(P)-dependent oxidoreductase [Cereibacter sphaeroides]MCE6953338.1 NAD(P)-dependent oxidoreductase [Cereibacter sphaeroides]
MRLALTGAGGFVGRFIAEAARAAGHELVLLSRRPTGLPGEHRAFDLLAPPPPLGDVDALVHCAFLHVPGRYRGGEGEDPDTFRRANLDGSLRLFDAMGGRRIVFLSSRAVFDGYPAGTLLPETLAPRPDGLYGEVKVAAEKALAALQGASLRATGVYGPGPQHKWRDLFGDFLAGRPIAPRVATEVHGADLAAAALLLVERPEAGAFHASDLLLDRHDLLAEVARLTGSDRAPPPRADAARVSRLECRRLAALGWRPGGWDLLRSSLGSMI